MSDDRRSRNTSARRRRGLPPWLDPDAPSAWWSAPARRPRVVDQAPYPPSQDTGDPSEPPHIDADPPRQKPAQKPAPPPPADSFGDVLRDWARNPEVRNWLRTAAIRLGIIVLLVGGVALLAQTIKPLPWDNSSGNNTNNVPVATHTPLPTPTPTIPKQTELDGVITITNLDSQSPYEGNVQIMAHDGAWYCRNAPLAKSTWHVQLAPGQSISFPCVIPVSTPSSLPPHTFRQAVPSTDGTGLALVDNPAPFQGTSFVPTPRATP